jgi:hypothetical protein
MTEPWPWDRDRDDDDLDDAVGLASRVLGGVVITVIDCADIRP